MLRLWVVLLFLVLHALLVWVPLIFQAMLTGSSDRLYWRGVWALKAALRLAAVRVCSEGLENIPPRVCVFAANHTSNADPLALLAAIPRRISILVKKELFRIPVLGAAMRLVKFVPVDRTDREAAAACVDLALRYLRDGLSFLVYPEGKRSPDGRLGSFKRGAFIMAIVAGVPVVPVSILGAEKVMRKGSPVLHPGKILVRFHAPVEASAYTVDQKDELLACVRAVIASGLPERQRLLDSQNSA